MPFEEIFPCIRVIAAFVCFSLYVASFTNKDWVTGSDSIKWGLWEWCYMDPNATGAADSQPEKCHSIAPGDSPAYYEAVRTMACFALVSFVMFFCTCNEREGLGADKNPVVIYFVAAFFATMTVALLGGYYDDDDRWKNQDHSLGWCYWLVVSVIIIVTIIGCLHWKYDNMKKAKGKVNDAPSINPVQRRASSASTISIAKGKKITIFRQALYDSGNRIVAATSQTPSAPPPAWPQRPDERESTSGAQFPVLTLPRYDIAPEPGTAMPDTAPPSYEDVMRGGATPPAPVLVEASNPNSSNV